MTVARRVQRNGTVLVRLASGEWVPEPAEPDHTCHCGFVAKTAGGLSTHERSHAEEE